MNQLDPIEEVYNIEDEPQVTKVVIKLDFDLEKGLADLYLEL